MNHSLAFKNLNTSDVAFLWNKMFEFYHVPKFHAGMNIDSDYLISSLEKDIICAKNEYKRSREFLNIYFEVEHSQLENKKGFTLKFGIMTIDLEYNQINRSCTLKFALISSSDCNSDTLNLWNNVTKALYNTEKIQKCDKSNLIKFFYETIKPIWYKEHVSQNLWNSGSSCDEYLWNPPGY